MARPPGHPDNALIATLANHLRWSRTSAEDRQAATAPARAAFGDRWLRQAREQFGDLPPEELARRAESLRKAHFTRLALTSAQVRRARKAGGGRDDRA